MRSPLSKFILVKYPLSHSKPLDTKCLLEWLRCDFIDHHTPYPT